MMAAALHGRQSQLAPWRWHDGVAGVAIGLLTSGILLKLLPDLLKFWLDVIDFWRLRLDMPSVALEAMPAPSGLLLAGVSASLLLAWGLSGRWREHWWPLRVVVRGLCLVQGSACLLFALAPERFPYSLSQHLGTLLQLGSEFMLATPLMLGLGWGVLRLPWHLKLFAPAAVSFYFLLWLPHQVVLHAWVLNHTSVLFMPVLFLCFGLLLDGWLFIGLYAWLASLTPRTTPVAAGIDSPHRP